MKRMFVNNFMQTTNVYFQLKDFSNFVMEIICLYLIVMLIIQSWIFECIVTVPFLYYYNTHYVNCGIKELLLLLLLLLLKAWRPLA